MNAENTQVSTKVSCVSMVRSRVFLLFLIYSPVAVIFLLSTHNRATEANALTVAQDEKTKSVKATEFVLIDNAGRRRAQLGFSDSEEKRLPVSRLFDENDNPRAEMSISSSGMGLTTPIPRIILLDSKGKAMLEGRVGDKGSPTLQARAEDGSFASLGIGAGNEPTLTFSGGIENQAEATVRFVPKRACLVEVSDMHGKVRSSFLVHFEKGVQAQFFDKDEKEIWKAP
jgi:hypothetical protein